MNRDQSSELVALSYRYLVSPRDTLTLSTNYSLSNFDDTAPFRRVSDDPLSGVGGREQQDDTQLAATLGWMRVLSPRVSISVSGGARRLWSEGSGFTNVLFQLPSGSITNLELDEESTALVGRVSLSRVGDRSQLQLGFNQETRPSSGRSASIDVQTWSAAYTRQLTKRVRMELRGIYTDQESASKNFVQRTTNFTGDFDPDCGSNELPGFRFEPGFPIPVPVCAREVESAVDQQVLNLNAELSWRTTRHLTTFLSYAFRTQESGLVGSDYDNHRIRLGFRYRWDVEVP